MGDILTSDSVLLWSLRQAHRYTGIGRDTVQKRVEASGIRPDGERQGFPVYDSRKLLPVLFQPDRHQAAGDPDKLPPRERRDWYESEKVRLKVEQELGVLVHVDEYQDELSRVLKQIANFLEVLPDILERKTHIPPATVEELQKLIDEQRMYLAARIRAGGEVTPDP